MKRLLLLITICISSVSFGQPNLEWTNSNVPNYPLNNIIEKENDKFLTISKNSLFEISSLGNQLNQIDIHSTDTIISLTLRVDLTNYISNGGTINPSGVYVVGDFNMLNSSLPNWTNSNGIMSNTGNNIWAYTFTYNQSQNGSPLHFKFVNGIPTSQSSIFENLSNCTGSSISGARAIINGLPSENHWVKDYDWNDCAGFGMWHGSNSGKDNLSSVKKKNGFIYVAGTFNSIYGPDNIHLDNIGMNNGDYWLTKLDSNYNILWSKCFGGSNEEILYSMEVDDNGFIYLAGATNSIDGSISNMGLAGDLGSDYWIVKIDGNANLIWDRRIKGSGNGNNGCSIGVNSANDLFVFCGKDSDDGDYISGTIASNQESYIVFKLSNQGNIVANRTLSKSNSCINQSYPFYLFSVSRSDALEIDQSDNIFLLENYNCVPTGLFNWNNNYYSSRVRKIDHNLNDLWTTDLDDTLENDHFVIRSISLDENDDVLGGGVAQNLTTCSSYSDATDWISCLIKGGSGEILWIDSCINPTSTTFTSTYDTPSWINDVQSTSDGGFIAIGTYDDLDKNIIRKYSSYLSIESDIHDIQSEKISVFPNPTSNSFTISSEKVINSEFKIIDSQGREVLTGSMNGLEHTIDISKLSKGVYSVVFNNTEYPVVSVIKE